MHPRDALLRAAAERPAQAALRIDGGPTVSYRELDARAARIAHYLRARGIRRGDRVAGSYVESEADRFVSAYFGVLKAGAVFVPVSARAAAPEVKALRAELLLCGDDLRDRWGSAVGGTELDAAIADAPADDPQVDIAPEDTAQIIHTSGTTGRSTGVAVSHAALSRAVDVSRFAGKLFLLPIPLTTFAGLTFVQMAVRAGMTLLVMRRFDPLRFVQLLESEPVFGVYAVSSMWLLVLKHVPDLCARRFPHLRTVQYGAAPMPPSAVLALCDIFDGASVTSIYGLTEAGSAGCVMPRGQARHRPASVGKPLPGTELRIVDGEVWLRSVGDAVWVRTGDIGYLDADGYLYLVDRKKDLIIRGGHNIASVEVEDALFQHPAVKEAAVIGVPHDVLGDDLLAFVVPMNEDVSPATLRAFLLERLADYKVPRRYELVTELPRNALGKVLKRELRARVS